MSCMMHTCMIQKYEMTFYAQKCLTDHDLMYALWRQGKHISNLIRFFFANFLFESHYLDHLLFKQAFFVKNFFLIIFNTVIFLTTPFYSRHNIFFTISKIFFLKKTNKTFIFSIFHFLFKIKYHPTSRKKQNEKPFFCIFS